MAEEVLIFLNFGGVGQYSEDAALRPYIVLTAFFRGLLSASVRRLDDSREGEKQRKGNLV